MSDRNINYEVDEDEAMQDIERDFDVLDTEYVDDDQELNDDDKVAATPTAEEALAQQRVEELKARLEGGQSDTASALKEVAATMKELRKQPESEQKAEALEDIAVLKKRIADGFYNDPVNAVDMLIERRMKEYERQTLQPALHQIGRVLKDTALDSSKRAVQADETGQFVMSKYASEVEALINSGQVQIGPGAYTEAVGRIAQTHMDELIDWKLEKRLAAQKESEPQDIAPPRNASPSGSRSAPPSTERPKVGRAAVEHIYKLADARMLDREEFLASYVRNHPDEVKRLNRRA